MYASFVKEFADRIRKDMNLVANTARNPYGGAYEYELERALGFDMLVTSVGWGGSHHLEGDEYWDEWGVHWQKSEYETPFGKGTYATGANNARCFRTRKNLRERHSFSISQTRLMFRGRLVEMDVLY